MQKTEETGGGDFKKNITISLVIVAIIIFFLTNLSSWFIGFFGNPKSYLYFEIFDSYTNLGLQIFIMGISVYTTIVFFGYIIYLILNSGTRAEFIAKYKIKDLADSHSQLEELYENAPVPYFTINKDGLIVGCNKSALRFFGVIPSEIAGKPFFAFAHEDDLELGEKLLNYFKSDVPINKQDFRMITKEQGMKWVSLSIFLTNNFSTGEKNGLVTTFDLTEQKQLDQAKTEFVSLASHQLRTPLATFKWFTEMLASGDLGALNDKQKDYIKRMSVVNSDMIELVETFLNVSRIEIGTLKIEKQEVDVVPIVDGILTELESQIVKKQIKINKNFAQGVSKMQSDPELLRIAIQNLITNAIKYNKDGGSIDISINGDSLNRNTISVSDTGLGIPKEEQNRVFSKMFRATNVQNIGNGQSSGLGLYLVNSIVKNMGGDISFNSEVGSGTTFTLKL